MDTLLAVLAALAYAGAFTVPISMAVNRGRPIIAGLLIVACLCGAPVYTHFVGNLIYPPSAATIY